MSMADSLRNLRGKVPWLSPIQDQILQAPAELTVVEEMALLVRLAGTKGSIDRQSSTWTAVCSWAATELLETFAKQERANDEKAAELRARVRTLRDLIELDDKPQVVKFEDQSPLIP